MANFQSIDNVYVKFAQHPRHTDVQTHLNNYYAGQIDGDKLDTFFTSPARTELAPNVIDTLHSIVIDDLIYPVIKDNEAYNDDDEEQIKASIKPIINNAAFKVMTKNENATRLTRESLKSMMLNATQTSKTVVYIQILTGHIYFKEHDPSYLDWKQFTTVRTVLPPRTVPPGQGAPFDAAAFATALGAAMPAPAPPLDMNSFAKTLGDTLNEGQPDASALANAVTTGIYSSRAKMPSSFIFNVNSLPPDVKLRYQRKQEGKLILGRVARSRYIDGHFYFQEAPNSERIFTADGTLFLYRADPDLKGLLRAPVTCKDDSLQGIRSWYATFVRHAMNHGFYVHPFYCYRKDHGGDWGFSIGDSHDDDLPARLDIAVRQMSGPLFQLLQSKDMFPRDSTCPSLVDQCFGDGYKALKHIVFPAHPIFHPQPSILLTAYPRQKGLSMLEYWSLFQDFLQLRAFVQDQDSSLDAPGELDIFINGCKYHQFLNRITREERASHTLQYKYTGAQIVETLNKFLSAADSPLVLERQRERTRPATGPPAFRAPAPGRAPTRSRPPQRRSTPVNNITTTDDDADPPDLSITDSEDSLDHVYSDIRAMDNVDDPTDRFTLNAFSAMINRVQTQAVDPSTSLSCIVCGENHRFDKCDVLNNHEFLKSHYIRYCQQIRRDASARAASFSGSAGAIPTSETVAVHFVDAETTSYRGDQDPDIHDDSSTEGPDFQRDRR